MVSGIPDSSSGDDELLGFFGTIANVSEAEVPGFKRMVGSESFYSPSFGDGETPKVIDVYATFTQVEKGTLRLRKYKPDYGLMISDDLRSVHVPSITELPSTLDNTSYVWKSGHTTLTFELDWSAIGRLEVADGYSGHWVGEDYLYDYVAFKDLEPRPTSTFSCFRAKGKFNGSSIDSKVTIEWGKPVVFTDIYDAFSVSIADVESGFVLFDGKCLCNWLGKDNKEAQWKLENGYMTIEATKNENHDEKDEKTGKYIRRERYTGSCRRSFYVGDAVTEEDIKANFKDGILTVVIPKVDPKKIETSKTIAIEG